MEETIETIVIKANSREFYVDLHDAMQGDLSPEWSIIFNDWLGGFRTGNYGTEEASIRLAMIFTHGSDHSSTLNPVRWGSYGLSREELEAFVRAGLRIMEVIWKEQVKDTEKTEGKSSRAKKSVTTGAQSAEK